ncbi:cytochrome c [Pseudomonas sp. R16(2017)]|uniref:c-type cytochrome n=1 Tax=Pseudomonas sp. R16(2017) TaxID=1981704 RepID=UPI000A1FD9CB|nr:c-type cytochrome [Pseudomonas sp. R16(2017)]
MKRIIWTATALAAVSAAAFAGVYGPEMWQGYRFMQNLDAHDAHYQASVGPWPQLQDTCALCHGADGQSANARYPALAGQQAAYLEAQLRAFAQGHRHSPTMEALAASLSDEQIKRLAAYYAEQPPGPGEPDGNLKALQDQGKTVFAAKGCAACHGNEAAGGPLAPRIAGQGRFYLADQLHGFKQGSRRDPGQAMNAMAAGLSEADIDAVSAWLGGQAR